MGGVAHSYRGGRYDTLSIRWDGSWGLAFVPATGYQKDRVGYEVVVLQAAGLLFLVSYEF
jgi:hypothetical protein